MFREYRKDLQKEEMRLKSVDVACQETFHGNHELQYRHWRDSPQAPTTSQSHCSPPNLPDTEVCDKIPGIQDLVHLKLRKTIHLGRKRGGHDAIRERVRHMRFQEADMENRMDVHGGR